MVVFQRAEGSGPRAENETNRSRPSALFARPFHPTKKPPLVGQTREAWGIPGREHLGPLICPRLRAGAGFGTCPPTVFSHVRERLPRLHRASPSAALDKSPNGSDDSLFGTKLYREPEGWSNSSRRGLRRIEAHPSNDFNGHLALL